MNAVVYFPFLGLMLQLDCLFTSIPPPRVHVTDRSASAFCTMCTYWLSYRIPLLFHIWMDP